MSAIRYLPVVLVVPMAALTAFVLWALAFHVYYGAFLGCLGAAACLPLGCGSKRAGSTPTSPSGPSPSPHEHEQPYGTDDCPGSFGLLSS